MAKVLRFRSLLSLKGYVYICRAVEGEGHFRFSLFRVGLERKGLGFMVFHILKYRTSWITL